MSGLITATSPSLGSGIAVSGNFSSRGSMFEHLKGLSPVVANWDTATLTIDAGSTIEGYASRHRSAGVIGWTPL